MINFRSYQDLHNTIRNNIDVIPSDVDLIVGIPRSGLLVANLVALALNKPMTDLDGFIHNKIIKSGTRLTDQPCDLKMIKKALIIDDSLNLGNALGDVKVKLKGHSFKGKILFSAVYVTPGQEDILDLYFEICPQPRVFEWNIMHHGILEQSCVDIDGVLCRDPTDLENDDGPKYLDFISNVPPSVIPSRTISHLVTSRLEKYRDPTVKWLKKSGIKFNNLVMMQYKSREERMAANNYGEFKAQSFEKSGCELFIESSHEQAITINRLTNKDVYSYNKSLMLQGRDTSNRIKLEKSLLFNKSKDSLNSLPVTAHPKRRTSIKAVVYTCITAHYDELYNHTYTNLDWDYVCFTDDLSIANENNSNWQLRPLQYTKLDNTKNQRWHKLHPHIIFPEYEYSLWVDSNLDVMSPAIFQDVDNAIDKGKSISIAPHPDRDCIYDEMQACLELKKDILKNMLPQIEKFKKNGFPAHYGLFETNIMLRRHNLSKVKKIMNDWWYWVENYSKRDQLSLTYVLWKNKQDACALSNISYRNRAEILNFWPHLTEIRQYYQNLSLIIKSQQEQISIQNNEIEILKESLEKIQSAKAYRLWQGYNSIKRSLRSKLSV